MKKNKFLKGILSVVLVMVIGILAIIEIGIEVVYQLVKIIRNGYRYITDLILKKIEPIYGNRIAWKPGRFDSDEGIRIYEYDLDEELTGGAIE